MTDILGRVEGLRAAPHDARAFHDSPALLADGRALRRPDADTTFCWTDDPATVHAQAEKVVRGKLRPPPALTHIMLVSGNGQRGACLVLHTLAGADRELIVWGARMRWTPCTLRRVSEWIFRTERVGRLVAFIRPEDVRSQDLARRAGFRFACRSALPQFDDGSQASVWLMTASTCPWLR